MEKDKHCQRCGKLCYGTHCRECFETKGASLSTRERMRRYTREKDEKM